MNKNEKLVLAFAVGLSVANVLYMNYLTEKHNGLVRALHKKFDQEFQAQVDQIFSNIADNYDD